MSVETEISRCARTECQVCNLNSKLIEHGAEAVSLIDLEESSCRLFLHKADTSRCLRCLRLDVDKTEYRKVSKGNQTKMCDFAVLAIADNVVQLLAIELKSGAGYADSIEQLSQGLSVLHDYFEENGLTPDPTAYFVVGRDLDKLKYALRDKLGSLRFGSMRVKLKILKCGDSLHLE